MEVGRVGCTVGLADLLAGPASDGRGGAFAAETGGAGRVEVLAAVLGLPLAEGACVFGSDTLVLDEEVLSCLTGDLVGDYSLHQ